jgi:hypothetical protein
LNAMATRHHRTLVEPEGIVDDEVKPSHQEQKTACGAL